VFFYGGSWHAGADTVPIYKGQHIVNLANNVVVVTLNYRIGALGFLGSSLLQSFTPDGSTGNAGLQDQRMALEWVQANIAQFGGDPTRVTIFGQSAGGGSVSLHMQMSRSFKLFSAAIVESGPIASWSAKPMSAANSEFSQLVQQVNCVSPNNTATLQCLQNTPYWEFFNVTFTNIPGYFTKWGPVIDLVEIDEAPLTLLQNNIWYSRVPVMIGTNLNEGTTLVNGLNQNATDSMYMQWLINMFPSFWPQVYGLYPSAAYSSPWTAATVVITDAMQTCPSRAMARSLALSSIPVYLYHFTHVLGIVKLLAPSFGAFHGSELLFVYQDQHLLYEGLNIPLELSHAERNLQRLFGAYWTNFATSGNPNGPVVNATGQIHWPRWQNTTEINIQLAAQSSLNSFLDASHCHFWDKMCVGC